VVAARPPPVAEGGSRIVGPGIDIADDCKNIQL